MNLRIVDTHSETLIKTELQVRSVSLSLFLSLSLLFYLWPHCGALLRCTGYTSGPVSNKSCSSEFPDDCCWGASCNHNKNHRAGPPTALTPVRKGLRRLRTSSTAQVGASDNPAGSVPMDRLRTIQQLPKLGQRVERRSLKLEKFAYPSKTEWLTKWEREKN